MPRSIYSQKELRDASNHLFYEIWMFQTLAQGIASGLSGQGPINNALLESFVIHMRALIGFFYSENPRADDIIADDFFAANEDWTNIRPAKTELLDKAKKRADKEVAHLTYTRLGVTLEQKSWEFVKIYSDLDMLIQVFLEHVSTDSLGSSWDETKRRLGNK